jgi:hypothetical protein
MRVSRQVRRLAILPVVTALAAFGLLANAAGAAQSRPVPAATTASGVQPNPSGELDCNGLSPIQRPVKDAVPCADPRGDYGGRFYENGHYIGHDEPSLRFVSSQPGSGNNYSMTETLPTDPQAPPTVADPGTTSRTGSS